MAVSTSFKYFYSGVVVSLTGRVVVPPKLFTTKTNFPAAKFLLQTDTGSTGSAEIHPVTTIGPLATHISQFAKTGTILCVDGHIQAIKLHPKRRHWVVSERNIHIGGALPQNSSNFAKIIGRVASLPHRSKQTISFKVRANVWYGRKDATKEEIRQNPKRYLCPVVMRCFVPVTPYSLSLNYDPADYHKCDRIAVAGRLIQLHHHKFGWYSAISANQLQGTITHLNLNTEEPQP